MDFLSKGQPGICSEEVNFPVKSADGWKPRWWWDSRTIKRALKHFRYAKAVLSRQDELCHIEKLAFHTHSSWPLVNRIIAAVPAFPWRTTLDPSRPSWQPRPPQKRRQKAPGHVSPHWTPKSPGCFLEINPFLRCFPAFQPASGCKLKFGRNWAAICTHLNCNLLENWECRKCRIRGCFSFWI